MINEQGYMGCWCFNALSASQQEMVVVQGYLPFGWVPEGTECDKPAECEVTTMYDDYPGPRFLCLRCAAQYLLVMSSRHRHPSNVVTTFDS